MTMKEVEITAESLAKLTPAKVCLPNASFCIAKKSHFLFQQPNDTTTRVNSLSYGLKGDHMIMSTDDDSMFLYDMNTGLRSRSVNSKKYGCSHVKFASDSMCALHGSTKVDSKFFKLN